jgi:hypothetical protein
LLAFALALGCAQSTWPARRSSAVVPTTTASLATRIYIYPARGQSAALQDRDRYECHSWAVRKTDFDPSVAPYSSSQQVMLVPVPPRGMETVAGTLVGAAIGAGIGAASGHAAEGAAIGAGAGAITGATREIAREHALAGIEARNYEARRAAEREDRSRYNRALSACLEGHGYTIR